MRLTSFISRHGHEHKQLPQGSPLARSPLGPQDLSNGTGEVDVASAAVATVAAAAGAQVGCFKDDGR